jgi:hypothetical protein
MKKKNIWVVANFLIIAALFMASCGTAIVEEEEEEEVLTGEEEEEEEDGEIVIGEKEEEEDYQLPPEDDEVATPEEEHERIYPETIRGFWMPGLAGYDGKQRHSVSEPETIKEFHANLVAFAALLHYDLEGEIDIPRFEQQFPQVRSLIKEYHLNNISVFLTIELLGPEMGQFGPGSIPASVSGSEAFISQYDRCLEKLVVLAEEEKVEYFAPMNEPDWKLGSEVVDGWSGRMLQIVQKGFTGKIVYKGSLSQALGRGEKFDFSGYGYVGLTSGPFGGNLESYCQAVVERFPTFIEWSREDKFEPMVTEFGVSGLEQNTAEEKQAEALAIVFEEGIKNGIRTYIVSDLPEEYRTKIKGTALEPTVKEYFLRLEQTVPAPK